MVRERASSSRTIGAGAKSRDSEFGPKLSARYLMIVFLSLAHDTGSDHRFVGEDPALSGEHFLDSGTPRRFISKTPLMKSSWTVAAQAIKLDEITTAAGRIQRVEIDNSRRSLRRTSNASIVLLGAGARN